MLNFEKADSDSIKLNDNLAKKSGNDNISRPTKKGSQFLESLVFFWCREPESIMMLCKAFRDVGVKMVLGADKSNVAFLV